MDAERELAIRRETWQEAMGFVADFIGEHRTVYSRKQVEGDLLNSMLDRYMQLQWVDEGPQLPMSAEL